MQPGSARADDDSVVVEEPLELRVNNTSIAVTMRTPGDDFDLAVGFLWSEGVLNSLDAIGTMAYCAKEEDPAFKNVINVTLASGDCPPDVRRSGWTSSSCGLCGKSTIDAIRRKVPPLRSSCAIRHDVLALLPERMLERQVNFNYTGGIHAAALFDPSGNLLLLREDLGRHNAVDKVLGGALRSGIDTSEAVLMVSGRLGFEIAQKAAVARIPIVASVSAPSSLAVALAEEVGQTAVGFVRNGSVNIYSHPQRIIDGISKYSDRNPEPNRNLND
jgi:FdhD protein